MCGITGFVNLNYDLNEEQLYSMGKRMVSTLKHRGPNSRGVWTDPIANVMLAHARLSIIDLSELGAQPMVSGSGRFVISYNGEIYNFKLLREKLENLNCRFRGNSDTEVILHAIEEWGLIGAVKEFIGMFAFALWDKRDRSLYLVRDRMGIKPLYYGWINNSFIFASELKAIKAHPDFKQKIDREAVALMMRYGYVPTPHSIYEDIYKLPSGTFLRINLEDKEKGLDIKPISYWSIEDVAKKSIHNTSNNNSDYYINELDNLLNDAVKLRMISDVPLGVFLSGGIDSSTITAIMQKQSSSPVKTYSIGFHHEQFNEAKYALEIANYLGTEHTEFYVTPKEAMDVIPQLPILYDEPFSDSSQIPTFLVSKLARQHVTVSLSGDGGDELFGGYTRYVHGNVLDLVRRFIPLPLRYITQSMVTKIPTDYWDKLFSLINNLSAKRLRFRRVGDRLHNLVNIINAQSQKEMYDLLIGCWQDLDQLIIGKNILKILKSNQSDLLKIGNFIQGMMLQDAATYLQDDILAKVDRASMGVSLEVRVPILDHKVVEFALSVPVDMKIRRGKGKWLLREVLNRYIPKELTERQKMGFGVPVDKWIRLELRDWAESLINESRLEQEGFFNPQLVRKSWNEHLTGKRNWKRNLWNILMFQAWLEKE